MRDFQFELENYDKKIGKTEEYLKAKVQAGLADTTAQVLGAA